MWELQKTTTQKARKDYECEASEWILNACDPDEFSKEDREVIEKAKSEEFMIRKGEQYTKTTGKLEGEFTTFRARLDMNAICIKYDLYSID